MLIPTTQDAAKTIASRANVRTFIADGTGTIELPGCKRVDAVYLNGLDIPRTTTRNFLKHDPGKALDQQTVEIDHWVFMEDPTGMPVLHRSHLSNDGIWQAGAKVMVEGEWEDDKPAAKKTK